MILMILIEMIIVMVHDHIGPNLVRQSWVLHIRVRPGTFSLLDRLLYPQVYWFYTIFLSACLFLLKPPLPPSEQVQSLNLFIESPILLNLLSPSCGCILFPPTVSFHP